MSNAPFDSDDDDDQRSFLQRYRVAIGLGVVALGVLGTVVFKMVNSHGSSAHQAPEAIMVKLPPMPTPYPTPLPPPPPPQPQDAPKEQEKEETAPAPTDEKPEPPKPQEPPAAPLGTNIAGEGNDGFGLAHGGGSGGNWLGGGNGSGSGGGSLTGWYLGQVGKSIKEALSRNTRLRSADFRGDLRVWLDSTGRITRVKLAQSTGDAAVDNEIETALTGIQQSEPPPKGVKMVHLHITELRPK